MDWISMTKVLHFSSSINMGGKEYKGRGPRSGEVEGIQWQNTCYDDHNYARALCSHCSWFCSLCRTLSLAEFANR